MATLRGTASSGTAAAISNQYVLVQAIDPETRTAHVVNQVKATRQIALTHMVGKGVGFPRVGETWLITSQFGPWMFVAQVNPEYPTYVESDDSRLSDARTPTGTAGGVLGGTYPNPSVPAPAPRYIGTGSEPAFQNGWVNWGAPYEPAYYYKDVGGFVHVGGLVKSGTIALGSTGIIFTLPSGFRPSARKVFNSNVSANTSGRTDVDSAGNVYASGTAIGTNAYWSLEGVTFLGAN